MITPHEQKLANDHETRVFAFVLAICKTCFSKKDRVTYLIGTHGHPDQLSTGSLWDIVNSAKDSAIAA